MAKLWAGRTNGEVNTVADDFNRSISFDKRLYREDITGSMAHATMLAACGIIEQDEATEIVAGLEGILSDLSCGKLAFDMEAEDIHTFVEQTLVARIGEAGKKLHTARSRNDQVALDMRLYVRSEIDVLVDKLKALATALTDKAEQYSDTVMCGYTHLQRAQPITFGHHLMAYVWMFLRDIDRLGDCKKRLNISPIGSCALAGTTYPTDRVMEAKALGFDDICPNSIDGVSDRDYLVELLSALSLVAVHLSRLSEEIVMWCSWEFRFVSLSDDFCTGSSIMPQKKNPDMAELCRGKTGRVFGDLMALLGVLKGLPLAYNKDLQEDKEIAFDAIDTIEACLDVFAPMIASMQANEQKMLDAAKQGFINATDLADYLAKKGVPFRTAYHLVGEIVALCIQQGQTLDTLPFAQYRQLSPLFEEDLYQAISLQTCVSTRISAGGTSVQSVQTQIDKARALLGA